MADLPFRVQAASSAGSGSSGDNSFIGQGGENAAIDQTQGQAPGGRWPQDDLPMSAIPSGEVGWAEGFSPSPDNGPMPSDHMDGTGRTPSGIRR